MASEVGGQLSVRFLSFGFKHGLPPEAELVYDLRMLPNPHWQPALRGKTGLDSEVAAFLGAEPLVNRLFGDIRAFLEDWLPSYGDAGRRRLTIALGCTGGRHRSVYMAQRLYWHFRPLYPQARLRHREL